MVNTSSEYKQAIQNNRTIYADVSIALQSGSTLEVPQNHLRGLVIEDDVSGTSSFDIGSAIINQCTVKIDNSSGQYSDIEFDQAEITVRIGLQLSETVEWIPKGIYTADPGEESGSVITVKGYDHMRKFDFPYTESALTYPATLKQIVQDACDKCGVTFLSDSFPESSYIVQTRPSDEALTFRNILCWVGQIACCWFKCNSNGVLTAGFYDTEALENDTSEKFREIQNVSALTKSTEDIVITGVKVIQESDDGKSVAFQSGSDGYVLSVEKNELIGDSDSQTIASTLGEKLIGLRFRKLSVSHQSDPSIEAGDLVRVTDRKGNVYKTLLTSTAFQLGGLQKSACNAETPARKSAQRFSESTKAYVALRKLVREERTARETAVKNLAVALANSSGLYLTTETQDDGSTIYYAHNKPTLAESDIVWKFTAEAIGISTDGGKTYPYGFTVTGEMITRILQTEGINADWINSGALTVEDTDGNIVFQADITTHRVTINADALAVKGKTVATQEYADQIADKATNLTVMLSNEYQGIPTDSDGSYEAFPECTTSIHVLYGSTDITGQCTITATESAGITGVLDQTNHKYTVTALSTDSGWVDIKATYLSRITAVKRFTVSKVKAGEQGDQGQSARVYMLEASDTVIRRGQDKVPVPDELSFAAYYRDGSTADRVEYAGRFKVERSTDGSTWETVYLSSADETSCRYELYTALEDGSGNYIEDGDGHAIAVDYDETAEVYRCTLYASGASATLMDAGGGNYLTDGNGNTLVTSYNSDVLASSSLDLKTIPVVIDVAALTHDQIFNLLTNNGEWQGIFYEGGKMYLNAQLAKFVGAVIGGWIINEDNIASASNHTVLGSNGTIRIGAKDGWHIQLGADGVFEQWRSDTNRVIGCGSKADEPAVNNVVIEAYTQIPNTLKATYVHVEDGMYTGSTIDAGGLTVRGYKNRVVETEDYGDRLLFSYETPSPMFGDVGEGRTDDSGVCYIWIEDIFGETVDTDCSYQVFLQPYGDGAVYVSERTPQYFIVKGTPDLAFGWEIKAVQIGYDTLRMEQKGSERSSVDNSIDYADEAIKEIECYYTALEGGDEP